MSRILPLPSDAISGIQSSKQITSLQGVVFSLLENSLDARSSKVEISIDFNRGSCTIEDNGDGIPSAEFLETGALAKLYHTSKHLATGKDELHGSTGMYLASLGALSLLSITSKHADELVAATLIVHQEKVIARHVPAPQTHDLTLSPTHGTRVTIRDLFGNMPVRVKQRALAADSGIDDGKAWQELKSGVAALLLAWPKPCSVRLRDEQNSNKNLHFTPAHPSISHSLTKKSLNQLAGKKYKFDLKDALPILFQSGLAPQESRSRWIPLSASLSNIHLIGSICLDPAPTKGCQFISLGIHPCGPKDGYADLYDRVNRLFSNSSFGALEDDSVEVDENEKDRRKQDRRFKQDGFTRKQLQGRKGVDRWPMFVLQAKFKDSKESSDRVSERSLKAVIELLEAAVWEWLAAHHFRSRKRGRRKRDTGEESLESGVESGRTTPVATIPNGRRIQEIGSASAVKRRKITDLSGLKQDRDIDLAPRPMSADFSNWSRIKSGNRNFYNEIWDGKKPETAPAGRIGSVVGPTITRQRAFELPPLEAGQLSARKPAEEQSVSITPDNHSAPRPVVRINESQVESSDDYGSVDSQAMMHVADTFENGDDYDAVPDMLTEWTDPITRQTYAVNSRTGVVLSTRTRVENGDDDGTASNTTAMRASAAINTALTSANLPLTLSKRPSTANRSNSDQWLPGFLKDWNNPVFTRQKEEPIPVASFDGPGIDAAEFASRSCSHDERTKNFELIGSGGTRKLSKTALEEAKVVRQVDQKFILCKVKEGHEQVLVLVDQHAASERVILEQLMKELCTPVQASEAQFSGSRVKTVPLEKPLRFEIPEAESELFDRYRQHFADWGILYVLKQRSEEVTPSQVRTPKPEHTIVVKALPPGIAERCTLTPKLLIELLRSEIWTRSSSNKPKSANPTDDIQTHQWLTSMNNCPKGILDLLNSRACRSAIMFNDHLSNEQCGGLLSEVSRCAFPFMCAHGRVSMVPVVELGIVGGSEDLDGKVEHGDGGFVGAFRRWNGVNRIGSGVGRDEIDTG